MTTMKEIARKAGVSLATVSRVINDNAYVEPERKEKVLYWIKKTGYIPSTTAQTLARKNKSCLLGVIISDISNPYFVEILKEIESLAVSNNYSIIFRNTNENSFIEKQAVNEMIGRSVDGIILVPRSSKNTVFESVKEREIPLVCLTKKLNHYPSIEISHVKAGELAAKHLFYQGYENFIYVGIAEENDEKLLGFQNGLSNSGVNLNDIIEIDQKELENPGLVCRRIEEYIMSEKLPLSTGFFTQNDIFGITVQSVLKENGYSIPEEFGIVGFDNTYLAGLNNINLSSIAQPVDEMTKEAFDILLDTIQNGYSNKNNIYDIFQPRLVIRNSSKKG